MVRRLIWFNDDPAMKHCWIVVGVQNDRKTLSSNREKWTIATLDSPSISILLRSIDIDTAVTASAISMKKEENASKLKCTGISIQ